MTALLYSNAVPALWFDRLTTNGYGSLHELFRRIHHEGEYHAFFTS